MKKLDTSRFLVIGEGLAAGMTNFSLIEDDQRDSFSVQMARRIGEKLVTPFFQAPGIGDAPGFPRLPVRVPWDMQTTVLSPFPPVEPYTNLSLPGLTASDVLARRPEIPVVCPDDALQTAINLVLGLQPCLAGASPERPTVLEHAARVKPGLAVVELGFVEVLRAAVAGDPGAMPGASFLQDLGTIVTTLRSAGSDVILLTVPDPMDTAHFTTIEAASRILKLPAARVASAFGVKPDDRMTPNGLMEAGYQVCSKRYVPLPKGSVIAGQSAADISRRVQALNKDVIALAERTGALVFDLCALFRQVRKEGVQIRSKRLTADFLGGFYSLNGYYPGKIGQALITNGLVDLVSRTCETHYRPLEIGPIMLMTDAVMAYQGAEGPMRGTLSGAFGAAGASARRLMTLAKFVAGMARAKRDRKALPAPAPGGSHPDRWTIKLPPGLEQTLPLASESSYYGDALRAVHTTEAQPKVYGLTGNLLFGGFALLDTNLRGSVHIKFSPPQNDSTHFEISLGAGLKGNDGRLSAPQFFCLPSQQSQVMNAHDELSSGDLDLVTGIVTNLKCKFFFLNTAIFALAAVNPTLPAAPIDFPGIYGSAWARFDPREDGRLDFTLYATTFIPLSVLGAPVRFPLPFTSASGRYASIPSDGTALHPHIHLSTRPQAAAEPGVQVPDIPTNTVWEMMGSMHNNTYGDDFRLVAPELGGGAMGRTHVNCRYSVQFGERFGDAVSIQVTLLPPGGLICEVPQTPLAAAFGSRIPRGGPGHSGLLRFPKITYHMSDVSMVGDPLDVPLAAVNVKTGRFVGGMLHRGIISQRIIRTLLVIEPRTPTETFTFRGPGSIEEGTDGRPILRFNGVQYLPYPEGFKFPSDDLKSYVVIGPGALLLPYLRHQAMLVEKRAWVPRSGEGRLTSSFGEEFSYKYVIPQQGGTPFFEYTNYANGGTFKMVCLTWLNYLRSRTSTAPAGEYDTVTFTGLGSWSNDPTGGVHVACAQFCTSPQFPYLSILIDFGTASNVDTKPVDHELTMP
jgi:hypothetical protein